MGELLENLVPGALPHYFVILTLASFAQADGKHFCEDDLLTKDAF